MADVSLQNGASLWLSCNPRPAAGAAFSLLDNRPVLFSESAQKIYELNQVAGYIWCCILDGKPVQTICEDLTKFGIVQPKARQYVYQALRSWLRLGLLSVDWDCCDDHAFVAQAGRLIVNIRSSSQRLAELLKPLFDRCGSGGPAAHDTLDVVEIERLVHVFQNGACVFRCTVNELVPTIKAYFSKHIIDKHPSDVAFHAACLMRDGRGLLISGHPGAGKTTLALHLMESGFDYGSDDITLISPDGRAEGIPFAPVIKSGAWPLVRKFRKDLDDAIVHKRPDGQRVRYLKASRPAPTGNCPVGWIVFIRRMPRVAAKLAPLGELEALSRLIEASCSAHGKMTNRAFHAIRRTLAAANPLELTYSSATRARDALVDLCDGQR